MRSAFCRVRVLIAKKGETMSLRYKIPVVLTGLTAILTSSKAPLQNDTIPHSVHIPYSKHQPDALLVKFDEHIYSAQELIDLTNSKILEIQANLKRVVEIKNIKNGVKYILNNGESFERRGGTIAWRNNNPGCIRYSQQAVELGAMGKANGFAIFPDEATGTRAIESLLRSDRYYNLTIGAAITKYAPPHENNTEGYINHLCQMVGISKNIKINALNQNQMNKVVSAIKIIEGWVEGTETKIAVPTNESDSAKKYADNVNDKRKSVMQQFEHTL